MVLIFLDEGTKRNQDQVVTACTNIPLKQSLEMYHFSYVKDIKTLNTTIYLKCQ